MNINEKKFSLPKSLMAIVFFIMCLFTIFVFVKTNKITMNGYTQAGIVIAGTVVISELYAILYAYLIRRL